MTVADIVPIVTALSALIGAIAAAVWGHGLANAKDEIIKAKDAQIEALRSAYEQVLQAKNTQIETLQREISTYRELTPVKIREYFLSMKEQLEEYIEKLKNDLERTQAEVEAKSAEIEALKASGNQALVEFEVERHALQESKMQLEKLKEALEREQEDLRDARLGLELLERMKAIRKVESMMSLGAQQEERAERGICPVCGGSNFPSARFCVQCGRPLNQ